MMTIDDDLMAVIYALYLVGLWGAQRLHRNKADDPSIALLVGP